MILFYQWNAFMQRGMENALKRLNIEYEVYYDCARDWDSDNEFADKFRKRITAGIYDVVISVNFMPAMIVRLSMYHGCMIHLFISDALIPLRINVIIFFSLTGHRRIIILQMG